MRPAEALTAALRSARRPALVAFLTAGYPARATFLSVLADIAAHADAVEIGVPFSDPMADGVTIQRSSRAAIEQGVSLRWILDELERRAASPTPVLLMSYLNPLLAFGYEALAARAAAARVSGFIVPDLPLEESAPLRVALEPHGLALVQLVTPATPESRLAELCAASQGFVYAVTRAGVTGDVALPPETAQYLQRHLCDGCSAAGLPGMAAGPAAGLAAGRALRPVKQLTAAGDGQHGVPLAGAWTASRDMTLPARRTFMAEWKQAA